jgi:hypothetical protein
MSQRLWSRRAALQLGLNTGLTSLVVACTGSSPATPAAATVGPAAPSTPGATATVVGAGQPKKGGIFTTSAAGNPPDLDPYSSTSEAASLFASYSDCVTSAQRAGDPPGSDDIAA